MIDYEQMFSDFCEIVDEEENINGVRVTRDLVQFNIEFPEVEGYFVNWCFYNEADDEIPYILALYAPLNSDGGDVKFMIIGAKRDDFVDWETGIKMVIGE